MKNLNLETAKRLLHQNVQNINLRGHCYAVGIVLAAYFDFYLTEEGKAPSGDFNFYSLEKRATGGLTKEQWEIVGTLHDSDYERTKENPEMHTVMLLDWLKDYDVPEEMLNVFKSHNNHVTRLRDPQKV